MNLIFDYLQFVKLLNGFSLNKSLRFESIGKILQPLLKYLDTTTGDLSDDYVNISGKISPSSMSDFKNSEAQMYGKAKELYFGIDENAPYGNIDEGREKVPKSASNSKFLTKTTIPKMERQD